MSDQADSADESDNEGVEVTCEHCGYEWTYTGEMWTATCPRCGQKTNSGLRPDDDDT